MVFESPASKEGMKDEAKCCQPGGEVRAAQVAKGFEMTRHGGLRGPILRSPKSLYGENHCLLERLAS